MAKKKARKSRKRKASKTGQAVGKAKPAVKRNTKISKNHEEESYMVTIPIDVIYSLNSSSLRHCSDMKEEPSEIKTILSNELQEGDVYLDTETRNLDERSNSRSLEVRRPSLGNTSPARTILKEGFYKSNEIDFAFKCSSNYSVAKDSVIDYGNITRLPNSVGEAEILMKHVTSCVPNILSQNSMSLISTNESTAMSPKGLVTSRELEVSPFLSSTTIITTELISPTQQTNPRQPTSPGSIQEGQTISTRELINLREPKSPRQSGNRKVLSNSADLMNGIQISSPRLLSIPTVSPTPTDQYTVPDLMSEHSAIARKNTSSVSTSTPEQPSSDERVSRHNTTFAHPVSSNKSESPSGMVIQDEERHPEIATFSLELYSKSLSRKFQHPLRRNNEQHSEHEPKLVDDCQLLLPLPKKRPTMNLMFAIAPLNQLESSYACNSDIKSPELKLTSSGEMSYHKESKSRRRSHEPHSYNQCKRLCGLKYEHEVKRVKQKKLKLSVSRGLHESPSFHKIRYSATSTHQRNNNPNKWQRIRFSVSPEAATSHAPERIEDSDSDYGWEDPPPPKTKPSEMTWSIPEDQNPEQLQRKLTELDLIIQKKQDHYVRQLFNTDNFDTWDDDPALSNIKRAENLKIYKKCIPAGAGLLEKMNLAPLVGLDTDTNFQRKELPSHLLDLIKAEKRTISDLVIKFLMPYYNIGRIQSENIFKLTARNISHVFYRAFADEMEIRTYIDELFKEDGKYISIHNLIVNE